MNSDLRGYIYISFCAPAGKLNRVRRFAAALTWLVSGSNLAHITVSDGEAVLSFGLDGATYYGHVPYFQKFPGIESIYKIPVPDRPDLDKHGHGKQFSITRSLIGRFSFGLYRPPNCLTITVDILREAGYDVPGSVCTPIKLKNWLENTEKRGPQWKSRSTRRALLPRFGRSTGLES